MLYVPDGQEQGNTLHFVTLLLVYDLYRLFYFFLKFKILPTSFKKLKINETLCTM